MPLSRRLLVPDLALWAAVFTLFFTLFLFDGGRKLFRDSDTGWHIRTGEAILAQKQLPRSDPYSFTQPGAPWVAWEWGADALMGAAHRWDGLRGVALLYLVAIAACSWLWFHLHWAAGGNFLIACALASPMLTTAGLHWLARPHVFSWLFLLAAILYAEKTTGRLGLRHAMAIPLCTALWASLHASFFFAPLIALLYAAAHALRALLWNTGVSRDSEKARFFLSAAALAAAGSLLNPYGWQLHRHLFQYLANTELLARVGEFQTFNFHAEGALQILLAVAVAALGGVLALEQRKLAHFFLAALFLAIALRSARGLPVAALLLLPLANGAITEAFHRCALRPSLRRRLNGFLHYGGNLRRIDARLGGWALAPAFVLLALFALRLPAVSRRIGFPPDQFPVAAAKHLETLPHHARLLAPDKFGGYLIYRFQGSRKVFFDGRSDFYGSEFMKEYIRLLEVRPGWQDQVRSFGFTHALLPNDYSLVAALEQDGWRRIYRDEVATLLERGKAL